MKIGIMSAMPEEMNGLIPFLEGHSRQEMGMRTYHSGRLWGHEATIVFSRWGKVAAATTATNLISLYNCDQIIFTGVAGGVDPVLKVGDVVVAKTLCQHDMDASPIFAPREIPLLGVTNFEADENLVSSLTQAAHSFLKTLASELTPKLTAEFSLAAPKVIQGHAVSGDKFFSCPEELARLRETIPGVSCVEMEGAAMAQVCFEYGIPFAVVRTISDGAADDAHIDFQKFIKEVASYYTTGILKRLLTGV